METSTSPESPIKRFLRKTKEAIAHPTNPKTNPLHPKHKLYTPSGIPEGEGGMSKPQQFTEGKTALPVSQETNKVAGQVFIENLRNPRRYHQNPYDPQFMIDNLGFELNPETGYFFVSSFLKVAEERYHLPLAFYIEGRHAMLVVKGAARDETGRRKLKIYDPFHKGTKEVVLDDSDYSIGVFGNNLAGEQMVSGRYDIDFLNDPEDVRMWSYREELMNAKFADFQKDAHNCVPYCLFVNAMLHGLNPNNTTFKQEGRQRFSEDFGVKVLTREEILPSPKPRVRIVE